MLRRTLLCLALFATGEAAKAKADPKECEVCIANLEAIDKLIDKDEKTSNPVWKSTNASGAQFFTKSFLGDDAAVLAPSSGEEPASPRHRAGVASMAWRTTR